MGIGDLKGIRQPQKTVGRELRWWVIEYSTTCEYSPLSLVFRSLTLVQCSCVCGAILAISHGTVTSPRPFLPLNTLWKFQPSYVILFWGLKAYVSKCLILRESLVLRQVIRASCWNYVVIMKCKRVVCLWECVPAYPFSKLPWLCVYVHKWVSLFPGIRYVSAAQNPASVRRLKQENRPLTPHYTWCHHHHITFPGGNCALGNVLR